MAKTTITVSRLQLAVNSEDSSLIINELQQFRLALLKDHHIDRDSARPYGYYGRPRPELNPLTPCHPEMPLGFLADYIRCSSNFDELFQLWDVTGRNENRPMCALQTEIFSLIIFCAISNQALCSRIINRLLREHLKALYMQLSSGHTSLVHSTVGLLISICRSSSQASRDLFKKMQLTSASFMNLLQRGKMVSFEFGDKVRMETDSRCLMLILFTTALLNANELLAVEMLQRTSVLRRLLNGISVEPRAGVAIILMCLRHVINTASFSITSRLRIVDSNFLEKLIPLYGSDDEIIQELVSEFSRSYSELICLHLGSKKELLGVASQLVSRLAPQTDARQRDLIMSLLAVQPSLLGKCVASMTSSWEPLPNYRFLNGIGYLAYLYNNADFEPFVTSGCHRLHLMDAAEKSSFFDSYLRAIIPTGLGKKELSKIIQSKHTLIQHTGLLLLIAFLKRARRLMQLVDGKKESDVEAVLATALLRVVPEFQVLLNLRTRFVKGGFVDSEMDVVRIEDDVVGVECEVELVEVDTCVLHLDILQTAELYYLLLPTATHHTNFDVARLLDDTTAVVDVNSDLPEAEVSLILAALAAIRNASVSGGQGLLGSGEDFIKLLTNAVVNTEWVKAIKRSPLSKLLCLLTCSYEEVRSSARQVLAVVLRRSGMFEGHGVVQYELNVEMSVWVDSCKTLKAVLALELLLRLANSYTVPLCLRAGELGTTEGSYLVPISPILFAGLSLLCSDFSTFFHGLPNQVKKNFDTDMHVTGSFFEKFSEGFQSDLSAVMLHVIIIISLQLPKKSPYIQIIRLLVEKIKYTNAIKPAFVEKLSIISQFLSSDVRSMECILGVESRSNLVLPVDVVRLSQNFCGVFIELPRLVNTSYILRIWKPCFIRCCSISDNQRIVELLETAQDLLDTENASVQWISIDVHQSIIVQNIEIFICVSGLASVDALSGRVLLAAGTGIISNFRLSNQPFTLEILNNVALLNLLTTEGVGSDVLADVLHQIASLYSKSMKGSSLTPHPLWQSVSDILSTDKSLSDQLFGLLWMVQGFLNDSKRKVQLFARSLLLSGGAKNFDLQCSAALLRDDRPFLIGIIDAAASTALLSFPATSLDGVLTEYFSSPPLASSALSTTSFRASSSLSSVDKLIDPRILLLTAQSWPVEIAEAELFVLRHWSMIGSLSLAARLRLSPELTAMCQLQVPSSLLSSLDIAVLMTAEWTQIVNVSVLSRDSLVVYITALFDLSGSVDVYSSSVVVLLSNEKFISLRSLLIIATILLALHSDERVAMFTTFQLTLLRLSRAQMLQSSSCMREWCMASSEVIGSCMASLTKSYKDLKDDNKKQLGSSAFIAMRVNNLKDMLMLRADAVSDAVHVFSTLRKQFAKLIKAMLKSSPVNPVVANFVEFTTCGEEPDMSNSLLYILLRVKPGDAWSASMLLQMLLGHSQYALLLKDEQCVQILRLLLVLLGRSDICSETDLTQNDLEFILQSLVPMYTCTCRESDRLIFRIVHLLNDAGRCPPLFLILISGGRTPSISPEGMLRLSSAPIVYSTLAHFPVDRGLIPAPFSCESSAIKTKYRVLLETQLEELLCEWCANEDAQSTALLGQEDHTRHGSTAYDPAFWVPAWYYLLTTSDVSVRLLANSGIVSMILAALASSCSLMKTYALACLQRILVFLHAQTAEKDASFRERHQLLLLVDFVRNAIEAPGISGVLAPQVTVQFLSRSALHLLQPHHELYGKINKYLLSRPYCDFKDLPLYEFVMNDSNDDASHASERLAVLRMLRDGLHGREDHLNLCRKHVYGRLMLLFPMLAQDSRTGHAILDLLDRAMSLPYAARYLIERCFMVNWLRSMISVSGADREVDTKKDGGSAEVEVDSSDFLGSAPIKMLSRIICLLRKCIAAASLLSSELGPTIWSQLYFAMQGLVNELVAAYRIHSALQLPREYLRQLLLCIWDLYISAAYCGVTEIPRLTSGVLSAFSKIITQSSVGNDRLELLLSVLSLSAFDRNNAHNEEELSLTTELMHVFNGRYLLTTKPGNQDHLMSLVSVRNRYPCGDTSMERIDDYFHTSSDLLEQELSARGADGVEAAMQWAWVHLAAVDMEASALPPSLGHGFCLALVAARILSSLHKLPADYSCLHFARWALISRQAFLCPTQISAFASLRESLGDRILSIAGTVTPISLSPYRRQLLLQVQLCSIVTTALNKSKYDILSKLTILSDTSFEAINLGGSFLLQSLANEYYAQEELLYSLVSSLFEMASLLVTAFDRSINEPDFVSEMKCLDTSLLGLASRIMTLGGLLPGTEGSKANDVYRFESMSIGEFLPVPKLSPDIYVRGSYAPMENSRLATENREGANSKATTILTQTKKRRLSRGFAWIPIHRVVMYNTQQFRKQRKLHNGNPLEITV